MTDATRRPRINVTKDGDGGITVHYSPSGVVVSIIGKNPDASGPDGVFIEVYPYPSDSRIEVTRVEPSRSTRHPTFFFRVVPE